MTLYSSGHPAEAAPILQKAVTLSPGQTQAAFLLAAAYADSGDDRAAAAFDRALKADPDNVRARGLYARYLWDSGRVEEGNRVMEEALRRFPNEAALHAEYGEQLPLQGKSETAARELESAVRLGDDRYETLVGLGDALWNAGRLDEAQAKFEQAIAREPEKAPARVELGRILFWTGRAGEAIPHLEAAVRARPNSDGLLLVIGRAYAAEGRLDDAERSFRAAVALDGENSVSRIALGQLLAREGKADEAAREIAVGRDLYEKEKKLQFERISRKVQMNLAWENLQHGKPSEALARFEGMPPDSDVLEGRAAALSRLGRHEEAIRALEKACSLDPENKTARARLAREYETKGRSR
jgi:tetratricopeptide (TPR) repeat protein